MYKRSVSTLFILLVSLFLPLAAAFAQARDNGSVTGLPLPRYVSLRSDTVYVRAGPGMRYPVKWVYQRRGYPLQVTQEFDTWRKIRDSDGDEGWVHQSLLSGNREVLIKADRPVTLYKKPESASRGVAQAENGVVAKLERCEDTWCRISVSGYEGWVLKTSLWGIYEHEESE